MELVTRNDIRNIAIIAHVDHGKTTLVDAMFKASHVFRTNEKMDERVMDSNDLEKERGITILSKNTAVMYNDIKINIVDTPGHADFGGEVERVLKMVDSVLLVVDSYEGPMPQTKFVLKKALELKLKPIVVINKIDKPNARPENVIDEVFDLFLELGADDEQLDFPIIYASAREGFARFNVEDTNEDMEPLFKTIVDHVEPPKGEMDGPFQMLVTTLDSSEYVGKIAIGKIHRGTVKKNQNVALVRQDGTKSNYRITAVFGYNGLKREEVEEAGLGDIIAVSGVLDANIGETIADAQNPEALPFVKIDEPTLSMNFMVNDSPFAGKEGEFVTSRHLRDRLMKELETNVSLRVKEITPDCFEVSGRGELHLSVLIETMRREGFELQVSKPKAIMKEIDGVICEPYEEVTIEAPDDCIGAVIESLGYRRGVLETMDSRDGQTRVVYTIPSRGLFGFMTNFLTMTKGYGIISHSFIDYRPMEGETVGKRNLGVLISIDSGQTTAYSLGSVEDRGVMFVGPGVDVYEGMIVGEHSRDNDLTVNVTKGKQMTNTRSSSKDSTVVLKRPRQFNLESCLDYINEDELVEVTPENIRLRKRYLTENERRQQYRKNNA